MPSANFETGMKNRREVLGDAYVDNSWKHAERNEFVRPLMEMVTEQGWGAVWGRDGLDRKTRSLITLAMLVALNRPHEIKLHTRGAVNNGCTDKELQELLIHAGCYCGWPASVDGFRAVEEVLIEIAKEKAEAAKAVNTGT